MSLLYPRLAVKRVTGIQPQLLKKHGIRALLLDADNTLTTHNNPHPAPEVLGWLDKMRANGIKLVIVSNNHHRRIRPFAAKLGLAFTANACKPLPFGFARTAKELGLAPRQTAVVGDQIFTDILGGNLYGAYTILVEPMQPEQGPLFRFKRKAEEMVLRRYRARKGSHPHE